MSSRAALVACALTLIAVGAVTPTAVKYGGVAAWGPLVPGAGVAVCAVVIGALLRRDDRPRLPFYGAIAVLVFCAWLCAWLVVQRMA